MKYLAIFFLLFLIFSCKKTTYKDFLKSKNNKELPPPERNALKVNKKEFILFLSSYNLDIVKNAQPLNDSLKKYDLDFLLMKDDKEIEKSVKILFLNNYFNNIKNYHQGYDLLNQPKELSKLVKKLMAIYEVNPNIEFLNSGFMVEKEKESSDEEIKLKINQILEEEKKVSSFFK